MLSFFAAQLDYIYFFYGLSFFFLSFVSYLLYRNGKRELPWQFLAFFGFVHGLNEWTEYMQIIFPGFVWLDALKLCFLLIGFVSLFEFGRRAMVPQNKENVSRWVYVPMFAILFVGWYLGGWNEFGLFVRYVFGAVGSLLAGISLWRFSLKRKNTKISFRIGAVIFWLYAFSQLLTNVSFIPVSIGFLMPLIRGLFAFALFFCIWIQYQTFLILDVMRFTAKQKQTRGEKKFFLLLGFLIITLLIGNVYTNILGNVARKELFVELNNITKVVSEKIEDTMDLTQNMASTLSFFPEVVSALEGTKETGEGVNAVLDLYQKITGDSVCYVMNKDGVVIASSNRNAPDSFVGKNYAFRTYFTSAMNGTSGTLFAIGVTSKIPGYYASYPVRDAKQAIIGAVVVKMNLGHEQMVLQQYKNMFFVSPEGVVFLSGDVSSSGKSLVPLSATVKQSLAARQQFGSSTFDPLFTTWPQDASFANMDSHSFLIHSTQVKSEGWSLIYFPQENLIQYYRLFGILFCLLFYFLMLTSIVIMQMIKRNAMYAYFASIVYASQDAVIGKDLNGVVMTWNEGAEKMYGYTKEEMIGQTCEILLPKDQVEKNKKIFEAIRKGKSVDNFEMKHLQKNGHEIDVSVVISPIKDVDEMIVGVSLVVRDISRMKKLEKIKSEFVSITSHQLRTPLTGIKWFSELLLNGREGQLTHVQKDYLEQIADSNQRMINLVNDMLEVSHIDDKGSYTMNLVKEDFSQMVKNIVEQQTILANMRQIRLQVDPVCLKKTLVMMDLKKMEQVVQNLLGNAIKFSFKDNVVSLYCKTQEGQLIFSVQDHGLGIPAAQQSRIFEKFFRADNSVDAGSGTGLGLYIAKSIVEAHKGKIWFESEEGKGTTFYVSLPMES